MVDISQELYRKEIEELTNFLRKDRGWSDLKDILSSKGFDPNCILLSSFFEDEQEYEYGVFVTNNRSVYEYKRSTAQGENDINHFHLTEYKDLEEAIRRYPQVESALQMIDE